MPTRSPARTMCDVSTPSARSARTAASPIACDGRHVTYALVTPKCARPIATLASPPPKVADRTGDWKRRSNPGGLKRSMISPNVTTRGLMAASARFRRRDAGDHAARVGSDDVESPALDGRAVDERRTDADGDGARGNPVAGVVQRHAAGRHQLDLRQRRSDILDELRSQHRGGKHFDNVRAGFVRLEDFRRREAGADIVKV